LSYPIGAETISAALEATPQLAALKLHFYSGFQTGLKRGNYEFLRVEYLRDAHPAEKWHVLKLVQTACANTPGKLSFNRYRVLAEAGSSDTFLKQLCRRFPIGSNNAPILPREGSEILAFSMTKQQMNSCRRS